MGIIFWLSSRTANESSAQSSKLLDWLIAVFGDGFLTSFIVRKLAHFCEYAGLCLLLCNAYYQSSAKKYILWGIITASAYSVTDEFHQLFVDGRSCEFRDWVIDTLGAVTGAVAFAVIFKIVQIAADKSSKNKNKIDSTAN